MLLLWAVSSALFLALAQPVVAADPKPPGKMAFQGFLTDNAGVARGSAAAVNVTVVFRLYNSQTAAETEAIWAESQVVTVEKGHFSVVLGEGSVVPSLPNSPDLSSHFIGDNVNGRYLGITVEGETEISPRIQFFSMPYAHLSRYANELVGSSGASLLKISSDKVGINLAGAVPASALDVGGVVTAAGLTVKGAATGTTLSLSGTLTAGGAVTAPSFVGNGTIPLGGIIMWSGAIAEIPSGWKLCDGTPAPAPSNRPTPNLSNRFIVGAGAPGAAGVEYAVGDLGGLKDFLLVDAQVPLRAHTHTVTDRFDADGNPPGATAVAGNDQEPQGDDINRLTQTRTTSSASAAATQKVENRPPYYALAFIMRYL